MKKLLFLLPALAALTGLVGCATAARNGYVDPKPPEKQFLVTDYSAVGDGATVNTKAIQNAIDTCAAQGGGVIVIPSGTFLSGALFFKQGVDLRVDKDGILKSTTDTAEFPAIYTRWEGIERYWTCGFLNFISMKNVELSGEGTIDGSGLDWASGGGRGGPGGRTRGAPGANGAPGQGAPGFTRGGPNAFAPPPAMPEDDFAKLDDAMRRLISQDPDAKKVLDQYPDYTPLSNVRQTPGGTGRSNAIGQAVVRLDPSKYYTLPYPTTAKLSVAPDRTKLPPCNAAGIPVSGGLAPPRSVVFQNCDNVRVANLHLLNEARWGFTFTYCHNVIAENLNVFCEKYIASSDGFDVDSSKHVLITGCSIDCFDDNITLKSGKDDDGRRVNIPCEDIVIEKTRFGNGDGGAAMGSETSGGIRNVLVRDCTADPGQKAPIRFKSQITRGGVVENITYENITLNDIGEAFEFNLSWSAAPSAGVRMPPVVRNVKISNVHGLASTGGVIAGLPDSLITNVTFQNCDITTYTGLRLSDTAGVLADTPPGAPLSIAGLKINSEDGQPIVMRATTGAPTAAEITGNPQATDPVQTDAAPAANAN